MKRRTLFLLSAVLLMCSGAAMAQTGNSSSGGGCAQSPENPTLILGLLGTGGFAAAAVRGKVSALISKRNR